MNLFDDLTGNETPEEFAEMLGEALKEMGWESEKKVQVEVHGGFQPWLTVRLANGAEWQVTPVRSAWPQDGTSAQDACAGCGGSGRDGLAECEECAGLGRYTYA